MPATPRLAGRHARPQTRRQCTNRITFGALVVAAVTAAGPAAVATAAPAAGADTGAIQFEVSSASNRTGSQALTGATLTTDSFVFIDDARVADADLWLDDPDRSGPPTNHESVGPFDLKPGLEAWARKVPLDKLAAGAHSATARLTLTDGQVLVRSSTFAVAASAAGSPADPDPVEVPAETPGDTPAPSGSRPGAGNTGVPAGVSLTSSGSLLIKQDGAVISGLDIRGCVSVKASNVTIKNSRITCADPTETVVRLGDGETNLVLQDLEIDGGGLAKTATYAADGITLSRVEIRNIKDGPRVGNNFRMTGSWVHNLVRVGDWHTDGLQTTGAQNALISGNTFEVYNPKVDDGFNSVFMLGTEVGPALRNITFENNYVNGGVCAINMRADARVDGNVVFRGNTFGPNTVRCTHTGFHGGAVWATSNVWETTGLPANKVGG